jgi:DNA repair protein RadC
MKIKDIPIENQPRERLKRRGVDTLSDAELLAIILQKGSRQENVIDMSNRLLKIDKLSELSLQELQKIKGIGEAKAMQIIALFEFNKRKSFNKNNTNEITCAKDVYELMSFLKDKKKEHLYGLFLDTKNKIIDKPELITIGILDASLIHPREIFKEAIKKSSKSIILIHNHPSGDTNPSDDDIQITKRLVKAGDVLDVKVLDHVIVGDGFFSFREEKKL